jgi:hypothetical protein
MGPIQLKIIQWTSPGGHYGITTFHSRLVDAATLEPVSAERIHELHQNLGATGYAVKIKFEHLGQNRGPSTAVVGSITPTHVVLEDPHTVLTHADFLTLYEVD